MDAVTAVPQALKQANLSALRRVLMTKGTATRAELAQATAISSTTVRTLLAELLENGEIQSMGYDQSSGGRKAQRYAFQPDRYQGAAFCMRDGQVHALLVNLLGEIRSLVSLPMADGDAKAAIIAYLDATMGRASIRAVGIGAPGIVEGGCFLRNTPHNSEEFYRLDLGEVISKRYGLPVVLENDLNATAIGFGRCYSKQFPAEDPACTHMAYVHFEDSCVSAGFLAGGRLIRGYGNFAGELGLVPLEDGRALDEHMAQPLDDPAYTRIVTQVLSWVCGMFNPQYISLGGPSFRRDCLGPIGDGLSALLPRHMSAELLYAADVWQDFHEGMAHLTAAALLNHVQVVQASSC